MLSFLWGKGNKGNNVEATTPQAEKTSSKPGEDLILAAVEEETLKHNCEELKETVYEFIRTIQDPEKVATLEDLHVVDEDCVKVLPFNQEGEYSVSIYFTPTVPHCSLATLIGLSMRVKLQRNMTENIKLDIYIKKGAHDTEEDINKQINDKERIAAAMENPNLRELVEQCILEQE